MRLTEGNRLDLKQMAARIIDLLEPELASEGLDLLDVRQALQRNLAASCCGDENAPHGFRIAPVPLGQAHHQVEAPRAQRAPKAAGLAQQAAELATPRLLRHPAGSYEERTVSELLELTGVSIDQIDVVEINEAFASQSIACLRDLGIPFEKANQWGGALAIGHPLGQSGTRITVTLNSIMKANPSYKLGLSTMCVGFGQGNATLWERVA